MLKLAPFLGELVVLAADLLLLEFGQGFEAKIEDGVGLHLGETEARHEPRLGIVLETNDADHLIDVEVGDQVAVEHLEPVLDLLEAELRAPDQHDLAMREPLLENVAQAQHTRHLARREHVHVQAEADFELSEAEQALHQHRRIDGARLGLQDEPHGLGRLVAHVTEQRQFFVLNQLGDALDQARLLHLVGDLGDDDLVAAAAGVLLLPARAQTEAAAASLVGLQNGVARLDHDAAGWKIRARARIRPASRSWR